jgi:hypothetical protein
MRITLLTYIQNRFVQRALLALVLGLLCVCATTFHVQQTHAAEDVPQVEQEVSLGSFGSLIREVFRQMDGVVSFTAQALSAVLPDNTVRVDQQPDIFENFELPEPLPVVPTQFPLSGVGLGTLVINAPLSITNGLTSTGESTFASTSILGLLTAQNGSMQSLAVSGVGSFGAVRAGALSILGATQLQSLSVSADTRLQSLTVDAETRLALLTVTQEATFADIVSTGSFDLEGLFFANGGIDTNGADVQLGAGSVFASNIVYEVLAGDGVTISGPTSTPTVSFDLEGVVTEINGESGEIDITDGTDISISNSLRISNNSRLSTVRGRGGCTGCITDSDVVDALTINVGTIDDSIIGANAAAAAFFTEVSVGSSTATTTQLTVLGTATSTFDSSIDIASGCFSIAGVCVASASVATSSYVTLSDTPGTLVANAVQYSNAGATGLTQSADFVFDGSSLGIGTSSLAATLSVEGDALFTGDVSVNGGLIIQNQEAARFYDANSSNYVGFRASTTLAGDLVWTLPLVDGGVDEILVTDGSGGLRFANVSSVGGGSETFLGLTDTTSSFVNAAIPYTATNTLVFSSEFVFDGTNFGVGLDTPTETLNVEGSVRFQRNASQTGFVYDSVTNYVGIGTEAPESRLTVQDGSLLQRGGTSTDLYAPSVEGALALGTNPSANNIQVQDGYAYMVSSNEGDDFHIIDIADVSAPVETGALNLSDSANDLFVRGDYAYVVTTVSGDDFHIIDISDPTVPVEIGSLNLPTTANAVFVAGDYAYVVTSNSGTDFHIIDITDVSNPTLLGEAELPDSGTDVAVRGGYAYVTTLSPGDEFMVIDISDPAAPTTTESIGLPASANGFTLDGDYAYIATQATGDDFHVVSIADPTAVSLTGSINLNTSANAVTTAGIYAYVSTAGSGEDVHVIDISRPSAPVEVGAVDLASGAVNGVAIAGRYGYVASISTGDELHVIDVTGIESQSAVVHALSVGTFAGSGYGRFADDLSVGNQLLVGEGGIYNEGAFINRSTELSYFNGSVGIGTTTPTAELTVSGTVQATDLLGGSTNLITDAQGNIVRDPSDERLKTNIVTLEDSLEKVLALRGVTYQWKDIERFGDVQEIGFIAQEVDLIVPEVVRKGGEYWSLNTRNLLAVVVEAFKEVWESVQGNQERITELESRISELETEDGELAPEVVPEQDDADSEEDPEEEAPDVDPEPELASTTPETASSTPETSEEEEEEADTDPADAEEESDPISASDSEDQQEPELEVTVPEEEVDVVENVQAEPVLEDSTTEEVPSV